MNCARGPHQIRHILDTILFYSVSHAAAMFRPLSLLTLIHINPDKLFSTGKYQLESAICKLSEPEPLRIRLGLLCSSTHHTLHNSFLSNSLAGSRDCLCPLSREKPTKTILLQ